MTIPVLQLGHSEYIIRMEFALGGTRLVTLDTTGVMKLWDVQTGRLLRNVVEAGATSATADEFMSISSDGSLILLQLPEGGTTVFDALAGRRIVNCPNHHLISAAATSERALSPLPGKGGVDLYSHLQNELVSTLKWPQRGHHFYGRMAISSDTSLVAAPSSLNKMVVWETHTGDVKCEFQIPVNDASVEPLFSGDGRKLAFASAMDPVVVVDLESRSFSRTFGGPGEAERFWLNEDGARLAVFMNNAIEVWDVEDGQLLLNSEDVERAESDMEIMEYAYPEEAAVFFQSNGEVLFAWSDGNELYVDELSTGRHLWKAPPPPACPFGYGLNVSPNGQFLLRNSAQMVEEEHDLIQHLSFWDLGSPKPLHSSQVDGDGFLGICPFPDGQTFLAAAGGILEKRRWSDGETVEQLDAWLESVMDMSLSPDGRRLFATGLGKVPYSLNLETGEVDLKFRQSLVTQFLSSFSRLLRNDPFEGFAQVEASQGFSPVVQHLLAVSEPHNLLVTTSRNSGLCTWSLDSGRGQDRLSLRGSYCTALVASPDGRYVAAGIRNEIVLFSLPHLERVGSLQGNQNLIQTLRFDDSGENLLSGSSDSTVRMWRMSDGTLLQTMRGHCGPVNAVAFMPGNRAVISAGNDSTFRFWEQNSGALIRTVYDPSPGEYVIISQTGEYTATTGAEGALSFTTIEGDSCENIPAAHFSRENDVKVDSMGLF
ncbi:MAG: WD40 repeat domain-containing protein [Planctomycetota bacterium]|jgi:WD40 repeat protein|nr:WD40 repeat domain-containing protein [Planctomycetota bacterium]MDP7249634.1 WD40 repeat domain-containing protein [Planctomycetota bacterium]